MKDTGQLCRELEAIWHSEIPISAAMGLGLESFQDNIMVTKAALEPNINVHGTAFAGSLYSVQALTGWGMIWLQLRLAGIGATMVLASGHIDYSSPVATDIITTCDFNGHDKALDELVRNSRVRISLASTVAGKGGPACRFVGEYALKLT